MIQSLTSNRNLRIPDFKAPLQTPVSGTVPDRVSLGETPEWRPPSAAQMRALTAPPQPTPASVHITQFRDPVYNPGGDKDEGNGNCGPTSLAMGLGLLGLQVPGSQPGDSVQQRIDRARLAMHPHDPEGDGLTPDGRRSPEEHNRATGFGHLRRGAEAAGARTRVVRGLDAITEAVRSGQPVLMAGDCGAKDGYGPRLGRQGEPHIVLVSGYDAETGNYTINDPAHRGGPLTISRRELESFLRTGDSQGNAMAIFR